jgi:hypothetical protein
LEADQSQLVWSSITGFERSWVMKPSLKRPARRKTMPVMMMSSAPSVAYLGWSAVTAE